MVIELLLADYGRLSFSHHKTFDKGGNKDTGKQKGKPELKAGYECSNCHNSGHNAGQCDKICTRCIPSCGEVPSKCPIFLKNKALFSVNREERAQGVQGKQRSQTQG